MGGFTWVTAVVCDSAEIGERLFSSALHFGEGVMILVGDDDGGEVGGVRGRDALSTKEAVACPNMDVSSACGEFGKEVVTVPRGDICFKSPSPDRTCVSFGELPLDLLCPRDTPLSEDNGVEGDFPCPNGACPSATMASFRTFFGESGSNILTKKAV